MAITHEMKLSNQIHDALSNKDFMVLNFAWHMTNKSPRSQEDFWEALWAFIESMAERYDRGIADALHYEVARTCSSIRKHVLGECAGQQSLPFGTIE